MRSRLNLSTGDLDTLARLASAQREVKTVADALYHSRTSKREDRQQLARQLNAVAASLRTVELRLGEEEP
jgi:hypothetical protein